MITGSVGLGSCSPAKMAKSPHRDWIQKKSPIRWMKAGFDWMNASLKADLIDQMARSVYAGTADRWIPVSGYSGLSKRLSGKKPSNTRADANFAKMLSGMVYKSTQSR